MKLVISVTFLLAAICAPLITAQRGSYAGTGSIVNGNREAFGDNSNANRFQPTQDNSIQQSQPQYYQQQQPFWYPQAGYYQPQPFIPGTFVAGR